MKQCKLVILLSFFLKANFVQAQTPDIKFGNVSVNDLQKTKYAIDTGAAAVILADIGSSYFEENKRSSISLVFKHFRRVHVLNQNGFDIGKVEIKLYTSENVEEQLEDLKAVTYNLENGKVTETNLDIKTSLFKDPINKNWIVKKFTFPNLKAGSIIEYEYTIKSDYLFNLQPWDFQGTVPRLWSEYTAKIPQFVNYVTMVQGYNSYFINEQKTTRKTFIIFESDNVVTPSHMSFNATVAENKWAMKDVPALKIENYTSTLFNHISRVQFQLHSYRSPFRERNVMNTWEETAKAFLGSDDFGLELNYENGWMKNELKDAIGETTDPLQQVKNIYEWVRDNISCTSHNSIFLQQSLKNVLKNRKGNVAEVNLLLVAMLRKAGYAADPVLLSTRSNGYTHAEYPLIDRFNYVICRVSNGSNPFYLDASKIRMGFNKLDYECYNGHARVINEKATAINLDADSLRESKSTTVIIINDEKGNSIGSFSQTPGTYESYSIRNNIIKNGKDNFFKELRRESASDFEVTASRIDSLNKYDFPIAYNLEFNWNPEKKDVLYFNPMVGGGYKENPFKSTIRSYPVEMPYTKDEIYTLQMDIPAGYMVDELPKQAVVKLNDEGDAVYEYRISGTGSSVKFISRLKINKTLYMPDEYESLRDFFGFIVNKQAEQIVFRKKNRQ